MYKFLFYEAIYSLFVISNFKKKLEIAITSLFNVLNIFQAFCTILCFIFQTLTKLSRDQYLLAMGLDCSAPCFILGKEKHLM